MGNDLLTDKAFNQLIAKIEITSECGEGIRLEDVYTLANDCRELRRRIRVLGDDLGPDIHAEWRREP